MYSTKIIAIALQECQKISDVMILYAFIIANNLEQLTFLANHLANAYCICGSIKDARKVFDCTFERNVVTWNIMISGYAQHKDVHRALQLFSMMFHEEFIPNDISMISVLNACTGAGLLKDVMLVHTVAIIGGIKSNNLDNSLFSAYTKCGSLKDCLDVFTKMPSRTDVSWNSIISAYAQDCKYEIGLHHFRQMLLEGGKPCRMTYKSLLNAFSSDACLQVGKMVHVFCLHSNVQIDVILGTAFLNMYSKFRSLKDVEMMFDSLAERNLVSWNVMIGAYAQHGHTKEALELFREMELQSVIPDGITFVNILSSCTSPQDLSDGNVIYDSIIRYSMEADEFVVSSLVNMYGKCGSILQARELLDMLSDNNNQVAWNAMISSYAHNDYADEAVELFEVMKLKGMMPDRVSLVSVIHACSRPLYLEIGRQVHISTLATSFQTNIAVGNALVTMYGKCNDVLYAHKTFEKMPERDIISWSALITGYAQQSDLKEIIKLFLEMEKSGIMPNEVSIISALDACCSAETFLCGMEIHHQVIHLGTDTNTMVGTALVTMYSKCNDIESASKVFRQLPKRDVVSWSAMIAAYGQYGQGEDAFQLYKEMICEGFIPNTVTYMSILDACANAAASPEGKIIHTCLVQSQLVLDVALGNALLSMYAKCGNLEDAKSIFVSMPERDTVTWSALIAATAQHGHGKEAINIFQHMNEQGVKPDSITFVSILSACSHAGLIDLGCRYFDSMDQECGITPTDEHYLCMIDLFARVGRIEEAEVYLKKIPGGPRLVSWMTLLSACRVHDNLQGAMYAAEHVLELDPQNDAAYLMLSNIHFASGKWAGLE